jgi:SAM-dependent methyltransferase
MSPAVTDRSADRIRDVNTRYHDAAAESYDSKWGIDYGEVGQAQVRAKLAKAIGGLPPGGFGAGLEIGAGTGYFSLNLMQMGLLRGATATDISPGMLAALTASARRLGVGVETVRTDAERLPFADGSFDLVFGHAVLHHIPDLEAAFAEFHRVLRPGGVVAFCGEPSRYGNLLAALPKRAGLALAPLWRAGVGAEQQVWEDGQAVNGHALEPEVDVHAFSPGELRELLRDAGFVERRVRGEELLANMYGWGLRTMESSAIPDTVPRRWQSFAFRSYLALQRVDAGVLEPLLPAELFYNLLLSGRRTA